MATLEKTNAIVLRTHHLRETSLIVTLFSEDFGKIKIVVKGVRKRKSRMFSHFEPFTYLEIIFYHDPKRELDLLNTSHIKETFPFIRSDLTAITGASYIVELTDAVTQLHHLHEDLFTLLRDTLYRIKDISLSKLMRSFELKLLSIIGLFPNLEQCVYCNKNIDDRENMFSLKHGRLLCDDISCKSKDPNAFLLRGGARESMKFMRLRSFEDIKRFSIDERTLNEITTFVEKFILFHMQHELRTQKFLKKIGKFDKI